MHKPCFALLLAALPLTAGAMECRYSAPRNADIDASGLARTTLKLGSSDLDIQSVPGLSRVEVRGTACASNQAWLADVQMQAGRQGDDAMVTAMNNHHDNVYSLFGSSYAYLKLQVRVPANLAVIIDSGSGDVRASRLASLALDTGSGDLVADQIAGVLDLQLGSGDVKANQVGRVVLHGSGSGDVHVDGVRGDVQTGHSGSGDLAFSRVGGNVGIDGTGSGDVTLNAVTGNADIGSVGSGDVRADGIGGHFSVRSIGSGDIDYKNVRGTVSVPHKDD